MGSNCAPPAANAPVWRVVSNSGTAFEGVTGTSQLAAGMGVDMDAALQLDGSLLAALLLASCTIVAHACRTRPVVPIGDPRLSESIAFQNS